MINRYELGDCSDGGASVSPPPFDHPPRTLSVDDTNDVFSPESSDHIARRPSENEIKPCCRLARGPLRIVFCGRAHHQTSVFLSSWDLSSVIKYKGRDALRSMTNLRGIPIKKGTQ
jgi:hypothetical protein